MRQQVLLLLHLIGSPHAETRKTLISPLSCRSGRSRTSARRLFAATIRWQEEIIAAIISDSPHSSAHKFHCGALLYHYLLQINK